MPWLLEHHPAREEWEKTFASEAEAVAGLRKHVCSDCMKGEIVCVDSASPTGFRRDKLCDPPDPTSARDLLGTPCGTEYSLREVS